MPSEIRFPINVGTLQSVPSFLFHIANPLADLAARCRRGERPLVEWDFTYLPGKRQNLSAITSLLSLVDLVSNFLGSPQAVRPPRDPNALAFLDQLGVRKLTQDQGILVWPEHLYPYQQSGPPAVNAAVFLLDRNLWLERIGQEPHAREIWRSASIKDQLRTRLSGWIEPRLAQALDRNQDLPPSLSAQRARILTCLVETCHNGMIHGESNVFLGFQVNRREFSACVADAGRGFRNSLLKRELAPESRDRFSDIDALVLGSLMNRYSEGLRTSINIVMQHSGAFSLSSQRGELYWRPQNWRSLTQSLGFSSLSKPYQPPSYSEHSGEPILKGAAAATAKQIGYAREWDLPIVGSRVAFEVPSTFGA